MTPLYRISTLLFICLLISPADLKAQWYWNRPSLGVGFLNDIEVVDENIWWTVGRYGQVFRTVDGGATWEEISVPGASGLSRVVFIDSLNGWVYDNSNYDETSSVLISTDGGTTWQKDHAASGNGYFYDMDFDDEGTGWLVGSWGKILKRGAGDLLTGISPPEFYEKNRSSLRVFPNPFAAELTIVLPDVSQGQTRVSVYNIQGSRVFSRSYSNRETAGKSVTINVGSLKKGIYFIETSSGKSQHVQKVIKRN